MLKKGLTIALSSIALMLGANSFAQTTLSEFSDIVVSDAFEVTLVKGPYSINLTVDSVVEPFVQAYVKGQTLEISLDEKAIPKEVKKSFKGKNAQPMVLRAVVYVPEVIRSITLSDEATLMGTDEFSADGFVLSLDGKAQVKSLNIFASSASVELKKNSNAIMVIKASGDIAAQVADNAVLQLNSECKNLKITGNGSAQVTSNGICSSFTGIGDGKSSIMANTNTDVVYLDMTGNSKISLTGSANSMTLKGAKSSTVDAGNMVVSTLDATVNSATATVNVTEKIGVDLAAGATLYFNGAPQFVINGKISKSTLAPVGSK